MGFFFAWAVGEGIIVYRWVKHGAPPTPGVLLGPTVLFLGLAFLAEYQPARGTATAFAWAVDLAILLKVIGNEPKLTTGWPPAQIPDTQIWPGGAGSGGPAGSGSAPNASHPPTPSGQPSVNTQLTGGV